MKKALCLIVVGIAIYARAQVEHDWEITLKVVDENQLKQIETYTVIIIFASEQKWIIAATS